MKKYFPFHSVSSVKDPERLIVNPSSVLEFMLSNVISCSIHSNTEVRRTVLVITPCSAPALTSYSESNLLPMGTAGLGYGYANHSTKGKRFGPPSTAVT